MTTTSYNILSENDESTVVSQYESPTKQEEGYQSEADLEKRLIEQLQAQGYEYLRIHNEQGLISNLRKQLEALNNYHFSDNEWDRFFATEIAVANDSVEEKTQTIQKDYIKTLRCDDNSLKNIYLIKKDNIHANSTQVINQYVPTGGKRENRYDVTILVNGLPLVHIELKRRGVSIKEAFHQINRYGRESFWAGNGLYEYVQLFIISNGTLTKYYSNTTRMGHVREQSSQSPKHKVKTSNSYEFTNYWADAENKVISDLTDFTATFLSRHALLNILTRYCVFTEQKLLLAMRPYQIVATERVLNQIEKSHNAKNYGSREAGGYIWHTTGSGKTLTSFKTAQLATKLEYIDKVFFVVDRKDLDYQTMKEYDQFQKGAANSNTSTKVLAQQIKDPKSRIIITTIQKLSNYVNCNDTSEIYDKEVVIIFDECHRSQFGDMHTAITRKFKKYYLFGFTGTPIFAVNKVGGVSVSPHARNTAKALIRTTDDLFGTRLHTYTIVDAIRDQNVLPFRIAYIRTIKEKEDIETSKVWDIKRDQALMAPERIANITTYILKHFDQQTKRASNYSFNRLTNISEVISSKTGEAEEIRKKTNLQGFNSIFAVQSIDCARLYYNEFKRQMASLPPNKRLKIATIYSYSVNEEVEDIAVEENSDSTEGLDQSSRDFLDSAIKDYNLTFSTNYDTSADKYPNYYKDVSQRMKNREIDLLIVVNMFLTGFDATTLNTLWVDKNLRYHGLIQAFSRTNRILNSVKVVGNIVCFRNLEEATNKALALFGDNEAHSTTILRPFEDYINGYEDEKGIHIKGYNEYVRELLENFKLDEIMGSEKKEREFIRLFGIILRLFNLLSNFEQFETNNIFTERDMQDYTSVYIELSQRPIPKPNQEGVNINDDVEFEMELVKQVEVTIDYILYLVAIYHKKNCQDNETLIKIQKAIDASPDLRDKKELILAFIKSLTPKSDVYETWKEYVNKQKMLEFDLIIHEENLNADKALKFVETAFERGYVPEVGLELDALLPPINMFDRNADRGGKLQRVLDRIKAFFDKFYNIANGTFTEADRQLPLAYPEQ